ncbi:MAG: peptidoglycan D,D-transpeptidase FtsI family protein [Acidimicrobiales bacterium]
MSTHYSPTHHRVRLAPPVTRRPVPSSARRLKLVRAGFVLVFVALATRLFFLQVADHTHFAALSVGQVREDLTTTALRAGIYDRNGQILAVSRPTSLVLADDFQIAHPAAEAAAMSPLVGVPVVQLTRLLSEKNGYVVINDRLDLSAGRRVSSMVFPGIVVQSSSVRSYPNGPIATSVLGGTNAQGSGSAGLEYQYQSLLAGRTGITRSYVSSAGVNLPSSASTVIKKAQPGVGLELTLDTSLQFVAERALAHQLAATRAVDGTAIVMDVRTGEILADASLTNTRAHAGVLGPVPSWGRSVGVRGIEQSINNLAFSQAYEPGSVFKVVTFSAALQDGLITPRSVFAVPNAVNVGGRYFHDAESHGLEHLTATQILALSSNIGTYEVASRVGEAGLLAQVERLGFGQVTPVNFPGETSGLLVNAANWYASDRVALPIGQVDAVPPIQVLDAYNAIANGGVFVAPKLVRGYVHANGAVTPAAPSPRRVAISPSVDATMVAMLEQVVLAGTGTNAIIPGYTVAGKTGTASMPYPGKDKLLTGDYNATFVGFAPANAPVLSMIVVVERPQTTIFGGAVAAPIFQQVMSYALHHYGIPSNGRVVKPLKGSLAAIGSDVT